VQSTEHQCPLSELMCMTKRANYRTMLMLHDAWRFGGDVSVRWDRTGRGESPDLVVAFVDDCGAKVRLRAAPKIRDWVDSQWRRRLEGLGGAVLQVLCCRSATFLFEPFSNTTIN
jgi:hypothetical protein